MQLTDPDARPGASRRKRFAAAAGLLCVSLAAGCATHTDRLREVREAFYAGHVESALAACDEHLEPGAADADVLKLDRAVIQLAAGRPAEAERTLREVRDRFDYLEQHSAAESVLRLATDDQAAAYAGEDYEKVLLRAMLAVSNLMHDGGDALAYSLQVNQKQQQIIRAGATADGENPKLAYKRVALGAYLYGTLREATHMNYDDASRAYADVVAWEPTFAPGHEAVRRASYGRHSRPGHGVLYVLALVGRGPYKEEVAEMPTTAALLIADRILSHTGKHTLPPNIAPVKVPRIRVPVNRIRSVQVAVDSKPAGRTATITDVAQLALDQHEAIYPRILARAVVRRVVKKGVIYAGKEAMGVTRNSLVNLALDAGGVVWEATESADTRCWGLLPESIQVLRVELPEGEHTVALQSVSRADTLGPAQSRTVEIADGANTYLLAQFPDRQAVGEILASRP